MRHPILAAAIGSMLVLASAASHADALSDIFTQGHVDGEFRVYNYTRAYDAATPPDANSFAVGALIDLHSGVFASGFSLNASLLSANSLGTQSSNPAKVDVTNIGPGDSINALGQAYLQYQRGMVLLRGGYQYLATPWMSQCDCRVLPDSFNAISADFTPSKGWDIYAIRSFDWRSRTSDSFHHDNLYYPSTYRGDASYGGVGGLPATASSANGAWAVGTTYTRGGLKTQGWYYDFLQFAKMGYVDGTYTFKNASPFEPFVGAQYVHESGDGGNRLVSTGAQLVGVRGDRVANRTWGADAGVGYANARFDVSYNRIERQQGAVGDGALISPYTAGYATDPLYTTSMIRGLVEQGPGDAWKAKFAYSMLGKRLQFVTWYAHYDTLLRGASHNVLFDLTYNFSGYLKGLAIRERWEKSFGGTGLNPGNQPFVYNRVMISYKF